MIYALWGIGRLVLDVNQPMGGFIWYYDEAVSGGWIVNWDTGLEWPAIGEDKLQLGDRILAIAGRRRMNLARSIAPRRWAWASPIGCYAMGKR